MSNQPSSNAVNTGEFTAIFDRYNAASATGDVEKTVEFRTAAVKSEILAASAENKAGIQGMLKAMVPVSYTVDHLDSGAEKATLYLTGTFNSPQQAGKTMRQEVSVAFLKEAGTWKMGDLMMLGDPDAVKRSPDQNFEPESSYDMGRNVSMGGRVTSVKFEKDYTLVALRVMDEEYAVFFPARVELEKSDLKPESLVPWTMLQVDGHPHKTNTLKLLAESASVVAPE